MLSTLAMFVTGVAVLSSGRKRPRGDDMPVDTNVLAHDMRFFAIAYLIAIGAALLPLDPVWPKWVVAAVLDRDLRLVREGSLRGRPVASTSRISPRSASTASIRRPRTARGSCRACAWSTSRSSRRSR